jgi:hypothetical protein
MRISTGLMQYRKGIDMRLRKTGQREIFATDIRKALVAHRRCAAARERKVEAAFCDHLAELRFQSHGHAAAWLCIANAAAKPCGARPTLRPLVAT